MKQIILGTAGHIDHGKTSLIKAVTGIDTDRLKEEQLRGITIELGFAAMDLPSGQHIGIVDVPGHEKFVKNMVAGATGIDIVAMVIAADEGVMPQTREHMEICSLLDVKYGLVVLTKIDLVEEEWLEMVQEDIREFVRGSFLENAPIVPVSAATREGLDRFVRTLDDLSAKVPERSTTGLFRLPVDRVFTMKGFGTVITGTLISGRIRVGEPVVIYPSGIPSKVRGIQVHNRSVEEAEAGMRTAINFQGLERASIERGEVVSSPDALKTSYMVDVSLHYLGSNRKPAKSRTRVRFHTGTSEIMGNLVLLDREEILPGETAVAQIRLDTAVALVRDDRFVVRSYSPVRTVGGGYVLNPIPPKHKRFKAEVIRGLENIRTEKPEGVISFHLAESGFQGLSFSDLRIMTNLPEKGLQNALQSLLTRKTAILSDRENRIYIHQENFDLLREDTRAFIDAYHRAFPLKSGMPKEELKSKLPSALSPKLFNLILQQAIREGEIVQEEDLVRLAGHTISLAEDQAGVREKIIEAYLSGGLTPPYFKELSKTLGIEPDRAKDVLRLLVSEGRIVKIKEDLYFHAEVIQRLKERLVEFLSARGEISTPEFKEMTGVSRKFLIPLIEYFDSRNVTIRIGDIRKLRSG